MTTHFYHSKVRIVLVDIKGKTKIRGMTSTERAHEKATRKTKEKRREELREEKFRFVELVDLDESFKTKLMEELKEVENFEKWK